MRYRAVILLAAVLVACRPEQSRQAEDSKPPAVPRSVNRQAVTPSPPPPLLKTPRITIFPTGQGMVYAAIQSAEQAESVLTDIRSLPASAGRDRAMASVIGSLAKVDPVQARRQLEAWDDALISHWLEAAGAVVTAIAKSDPEAAAGFIEESVPPASQVDLWGSMLVSLPVADRLAFFERIPDSTEKIRIAADLVAVWLPEDPVACAAWIDGFAAGRDPDEIDYLSQPLRVAIEPKSGPEPWLAAYHAAESPEARRFLANTVWRKADPTQRAALIPELQETLPDLPEREITEAITADPAAYAAAMPAEKVSSLSPAEIVRILRPWAEDHPEKAIAWAMEHQRPEAAEVLGPLYQLEPRAAAALAPKLPRGKELDKALATLCSMMAWDGEADMARSMLPLITNPAQRKVTAEEIEKRARERSGGK
jgi:hypothetical protein